MDSRIATVVTVGTELVTGLRADTNGGEIARALTGAGFRVVRIQSVADDEDQLIRALESSIALSHTVVVTGGLGPTHDDITREAAARALGRPLTRSSEQSERLAPLADRHTESSAREQVLRQADVIDGARVIEPVSGTAPGQVVEHDRGVLVLLPGPPAEMRPMLSSVLGSFRSTAEPRLVRCVGITESDVQVTAQRVLAGRAGVDLAVLATPGLVDAVLYDDGAGEAQLEEAARAVGAALHDVCYSLTGASLAETVVALAADRGATIATAESCTGGLVAGALTSVPGSSAVFLGAVVAYANDAKTRLLDVADDVLAQAGAVSEEVACAMARGARETLGAALAVSTTGIAGPGGGTRDKPVGTVWFGVSAGTQTHAEVRHLFGDREGVRTRATVTALDMLRRTLLALEPTGVVE